MNSRNYFAFVFGGDVTILRALLSLFYSINNSEVYYLEQGIDFTIEPFKPHIHGPSSDKGKNHNYPKLRKKWQ